MASLPPAFPSLFPRAAEALQTLEERFTSGRYLARVVTEAEAGDGRASQTLGHGAGPRFGAPAGGGGTQVRPACCGRLMRSGALGENTGRPSEHLARQSGHSCCRPRPPDPPCGPGLGRVLPWPPSFHRGVASRTTSLPRTPAWRMRGDHLAQTLVPTGHLGGSGSLPRGVSLSSSSSQTRMLDERPRTMLQSPEPGPGPGRPPAARAEAGGAVPSPDSWSPEREGSRPMGKDGDLSPEVRPAGHWSRFQSPLPTSHVAPTLASVSAPED